MPRNARRRSPEVGLHKLTLTYNDGMVETVVFRFVSHSIETRGMMAAIEGLGKFELMRTGPNRITIVGEVLDSRLMYLPHLDRQKRRDRRRK